MMNADRRASVATADGHENNKSGEPRINSPDDHNARRGLVEYLSNQCPWPGTDGAPI
jgi:hypothetical protein